MLSLFISELEIRHQRSNDRHRDAVSGMYLIKIWHCGSKRERERKHHQHEFDALHEQQISE